MSNWTRVSDDSQVIDQELTLKFDGPNGAYEFFLSPQNQSALVVRFKGKEEQWWIETKETSSSGIRLCGMADWVPEILGQACWFELIIGPERQIKYWGDRIIYREDLELTARPL